MRMNNNASAPLLRCRSEGSACGGPNSLLLNKLLDQLDRFDYPAVRTTLIGLPKSWASM